jgi:hypothetical protein
VTVPKETLLKACNMFLAIERLREPEKAIAIVEAGKCCLHKNHPGLLEFIDTKLKGHMHVSFG